MSLITMLAVMLLIPFIVWGASRKIFSNRLKNVSVAAISAVILYAFILVSVAYIEQKFNTELAAFDLNGDGTFSDSEITQEQEKAMYRVTADTGRTFAPFTGAIFSFLYFIGIWVIFLIISWVGKRCANSST